MGNPKDTAPKILAALLYAAVLLAILYVALTKHQKRKQKKKKKGGKSGGLRQQTVPLLEKKELAEVASLPLCETGDYGDWEWDAGYKRQLYGASSGSAADGDPANAELRIIGQNALSEIISKNIVPPLDLTLPEDKPSCCPLKTDWQAAFKGYPTTFISMPEAAGGSECALGCPSPCGSHLELSGSGASHRDGCNHDPRTWNPFLNERQYERARRAGEKWDPYKHHNARQMYAQFLASNMPNRKAFYERPIEHLEEASCFQQKISSK